MEIVITALIAVLAIQTVYLYFIVAKQDEMIDMHNNFVEATMTCITEIANALDEIEETLEETE
tara:strand:+ start:551 stop:739 length:189 start_codon:yes stop_codon:yes gene_type:complete